MTARIVILAVNYRSDDTAVAWLQAVNWALQPVRAAAAVIIVDNTQRETNESFFDRLRTVDPAVIAIKAPGNLGYFGGAHYGWEEWRRQGGPAPDWVAVSNVDVGFADQEIFVRLLKRNYPSGTGVVGPSIRSLARRGDWNPKMSCRPTRRRMRAYTLLYRSRWLFNLYEQLARMKYMLVGRLRRDAQESPSTDEQAIYAPHGACIFFAREYFDRGGSLRYPGFLFGEEVFVAETARELGLKVLYDPSLKMSSQDHVSTGRFRSAQMVQYMHDSAVILADRYFH